MYAALSCKLLVYAALSCKLLVYAAFSCKVLVYKAFELLVCKALGWVKSERNLGNMHWWKTMSACWAKVICF